MKELEEPGYIRKEITSTVNKNGKPTDPEYTGREEYWSREAMARASFEDDDDEASLLKDTPETLLRKIGWRIFSVAEPKVELGKPYYYGDAKSYRPGEEVHGYIFTKYKKNREKQREYERLFGEESTEDEKGNKIAIKKALEAESRAREGNLLIFRSKSPEESWKNYYEELARYYIGPLDHSFFERQRVGVFSGAASDRYTLNHADLVEYAKRQFHDSSPEMKLGKMFEGFFYPLVRYGFFDQKYKDHNGGGTILRHGAVILSSDYDDIYRNKVDFAAVIPMSERDTDGNSVLVDQPVCFALTTATDYRKDGKIRNDYFTKKGLSSIEYPSTCLKEALPTMKDVPFFVIRLEKRKELMEYISALARGRLPSSEIRDLINYQIYRQADYWSKYWNKRTDIDDLSGKRANVVHQFERIANYSLWRMWLNPRTKNRKFRELIQEHTHLVYLDEMCQIKP